MSSRLIDNLHGSTNGPLVHPSEIPGAECVADVADWDEAQRVFWGSVGNTAKICERQIEGVLLLLHRADRTGRLYLMVVTDGADRPFQFWLLPEPKPETPKAEQPVPYVWPVNVIRALEVA